MKLMFLESEMSILMEFIARNNTGDFYDVGFTAIADIMGKKFLMDYSFDGYVIRCDQWRAKLGIEKICKDRDLSIASPLNSLTGDRNAFEQDLLMIKMAYE